MFRGYELSERKTEIKPIGALRGFLGSIDFTFDHYYYFFLLLYIISLFSVQAGFQGQDAMWLLRKATQKKQFAAAII